MNPALPSVATLWIGGALGWVEQLCLQSMLAQGHNVILYSYEPISDVPNGVECRDARSIWEPEPGLLEKTAPSFIADIFRIWLMHKTDEIWVDADILCVKPLELDEDGFLIGYTPWHAEVNNAVMRLPKGSAALDLLTRYVTDPEMKPSWLRPALRQRIENYDGDERLAYLFATKRSILGPRALTHCLHQTGELQHAKEPDVLSPVPWQFVQVLFNPFGGYAEWMSENTRAVHLWSFALGWHKNRFPDPKSFLGQQLALLQTPKPSPKVRASFEPDIAISEDLPVISSLWIGGSLSFLERVCLKSFADRGHPTKLYAYEEISGVPAGVEVVDARQILDQDAIINHGASGLPGPHSDKFRYHLLMQTDEIWVDTDAYCHANFPKSEYLFASHWRNIMANGVLRLPKSSQTLQDLISFTSTDYPDLPEDFLFKNKRLQSEYLSRKDTSNPMHVSEMNWEIWGPHPLTYYLRMNDELKFATERSVLYPFDGSDARVFLRSTEEVENDLSEICISVHLFGSAVRGLLANSDGLPPKDSYLSDICRRHGIVPEEHPIPGDKKKVRN